MQKIKEFSIDDIDDIKDNAELKTIAEQIIQIPNIANKRWVTVQYDSTVGAANASTNAPSDAAVVVAKGTGKALAMTTDCNSRYVFADPKKGAMIAVAEAARNLVCTGAEPLGVTNCLNFGNPYDPEVYYQFVKAVEGMGEACKKFNTPVTGGNVSFYNQNPEGPVYPTPTIGMVGLLDSYKDKMTLDFKDASHIIYLVGSSSDDLNSSDYLQHIHGVEYSPAPQFDLEVELQLQKKITQLIRNRTIQSAHDVSEGGLFVTLIESGFNRGLGFAISSNQSIRKDAFLFGEAQSRVVVTVKPNQVAAFEKAMSDHAFEKLGTVTSGEIVVDNESWGFISDWNEQYDNAIGNLLAAHKSEEALTAL